MYLESPTTTLPIILKYGTGGVIIALLICVCLICCAVIWSVLLYLKICLVTCFLCFFSQKCCFKHSKYKLKNDTGIPELYTFVQEIKQECENDNIIDSSHLDLMGKLK